MHCFFVVSVKAETCLPVEGLQFEKIGFATLFMIKDSKNWGAMLNTWAPEEKMEFRFFMPTKRDGTQNNEIHMNGKLANIFGIKPFK